MAGGWELMLNTKYLRGDTQRVRQLSLARAELPKRLKLSGVDHGDVIQVEWGNPGRPATEIRIWIYSVLEIMAFFLN